MTRRQAAAPRFDVIVRRPGGSALLVGDRLTEQKADELAKRIEKTRPHLTVTVVPAVTVVKTRILTNCRTGRRECWSAEIGEEWAADRLEGAGTPWQLVNVPTKTVVLNCLSSLSECRAAVATGEAQEELGRLLAQEKGAAA